MKEKRVVTCGCRTYNIHVPGEPPIEIGTTNVLKGQTPTELFEEFLKEYEEVVSFFDKFKLLNYNGQKKSIALPMTIADVEQSDIDIPLVAPEDVLEGLEGTSRKNVSTSRKKEEEKIGNKETPTIAVLRLNKMIGIKDEFTRADYQKSLKDHGFDISKYVGYDDIGRALALKRIKRVGRRKGRGEEIKYRVINDKAVAQREYRKVMKNKRTRIIRENKVGSDLKK